MIDQRILHSAVWTGTEMIIWGGGTNTGAIYDPTSDSWTALPTANAPSGRYNFSAVWSGSEMIVWGGGNDPNYPSASYNDGARYNRALNTWTTLPLWPLARTFHAAVWDTVNNEMIIWGGVDGSTYFNTGARYNPGTDSWTDTTTTNAPAGRRIHTAVWTGTEMIIWGGNNGSGNLRLGISSKLLL
ncbi:MAG: hypothetical protein A2Y62_20705 [Candidatus Fischerbacteria bacterium RBG_13_37_8]|uniref:Attractin/MKLN-like beta-propeller domain-containing protein n=1 Tax=Candidatus Fischerbacteria bacterium RBG_13_37_8 TaxID=1817863 RepID=A0A1F5VXL3_9BACT|nr:MAG: hypothetical protein A2Y62_20705 [Candidatus Fischerbacteria bacterium RBG_13_37_8]